MLAKRDSKSRFVTRLPHMEPVHAAKVHARAFLEMAIPSDQQTFDIKDLNASEFSAKDLQCSPHTFFLKEHPNRSIFLNN